MQSLSKLDHFNPTTFSVVHESGDQPVSVHMNPGKPILNDGKLAEQEINEPPFEISSQVPMGSGCFLSFSPSLIYARSLFSCRQLYYVQEASGMFLAYALKKIMGEYTKFENS